MGATSNYLPNGSTIIPALSLSDTNQKIQSLQGDGTYKWVHNANTPVSATESLIWNTDGSIDVMNLNGVINVKNFGATGDGVTNDTAAIQAAIAALPTNSGILWFPPPASVYLVTATLDFAGKNGVTIEGGGRRTSVGGIQGAVSGAAVVKTGPNSFAIRNLRIRNTVSGGKALEISVNTTASLIDHCSFASLGGGSYGIYAPGTPGSTFSLHLDTCRFDGPGLAGDAAGTSIALLNIATTGTLLSSCDFAGWGEAVRATGTNFNVLGSRFEVNQTALNLGILENGNNGALTDGLIAGLSMEANDTAISVTACGSMTIQDLGITGTSNSFQGNGPKYGIRIHTGGSNGLSFKNVLVSGQFQTAGIAVDGGNTTLSFEDTLVTNSSAVVGARGWDIKVWRNTRLINTNFNPRPGDDTTVRYDFIREGVFKAVRQIDQLTDNPGESKNLRGKGLAVAATTTGMSIIFPSGGSSIAGNRISAVASVTGGAMTTGVFFYTTALLSEHGELAPTAISTGELSVTVAAIQNGQVDISFAGSPTTAFRWARRIYRGTTSGVYDGYYETAVAATTFSDTGAAFQGAKSVQFTSVNEFAATEPDTNYALFVTTNWGTMVVATSRLTTGFSLVFSTTSPATTGTVDWFLVR